MTASIPRHHPLRRLFTGLVEHVFYAKIGMCDPAVVEYLSDLLTNFVHVDNIYALRSARGRRLEEVAEMLTEAFVGPDLPPAQRNRIVHKHIGDYTLFWTGVYPENLRYLRAPDKKDHLIDYLAQGKRSYAIASELTEEGAHPPRVLFRRLSDNFEFCAYGLGLVRKGWEELDPHSFRATRQILS